jgi:hypothetical protein
MLDTQAHPSILASVLAHADRGALLALRGVSRAVRERADARFVSHLCMYLDDVPAHRACELLAAPHGRIPAFMPADTCWLDIGPAPQAVQEQRDRVLASLGRTRILDIVIVATAPLYTPDGDGVADGVWQPLLDSMDLDVVRQFPNATYSFIYGPDVVQARTTVLFVARPPKSLYIRRLQEKGCIGRPSSWLNAGYETRKLVVHLLYSAGIGPHEGYVPGRSFDHWPSFAETVFVLNPYGKGMLKFHHLEHSPNRSTGTATAHSTTAYLRKRARYARRQRKQPLLAYTPGELQACIQDRFVGKVTVVNLARTPPSNLGFERDSDPEAVELAIRDCVQAAWPPSGYVSGQPSNSPMSEQRRDAVSRLTFLSGQEYADTLTAQQALDEGFVSHLPFADVRQRHLLPRPRSRPRPRPPPEPPRPPPPRSRYIPTSGPHPGTLDLASYPYIADTLIDVAPREALLSLRTLCRLFRDRVDARFMYHLMIEESINLRHLIDRSNNSHYERGRISSPLGPVPALAHLHPGPRILRATPPTGQKALPPAIVARTKDLLARTRVLDFNPGQSVYPYFDDVLSIALDVRCVRTFRAPSEPLIPFSASKLIVYHTPGGKPTGRYNYHRPLDLVPDTCTKVVHHLFPTNTHDMGFDQLCTRRTGVSAVVLVFTPHHPALCPVLGYGNDHARPSDRRAYLVEQLAEVLKEDSVRSLTLVNCSLVPHAWLGLPDDWAVADALEAEVRALVAPTEGLLRCLSGEEYAAELSPDELEDEGTIEFVLGVRHRLLPRLQVAPWRDMPALEARRVGPAALFQHLPYDGYGVWDGEDMGYLFHDRQGGDQP